MTAKKASYFITSLLLGLSLVGCERTKIGDIATDPRRFMNKEVNVGSRVTQALCFMGKGIY